MIGKAANGIWFVMLTVVLLAAQPAYVKRMAGVKGSIYGFVFDDEQKVPIQYANIILYALRDSSQVTGTITDKNGFFKLENVPPGRYYVDVDFIGYYKKRIHRVLLTPRRRDVNLKQIFLQPAIMPGETVTVEANRTPITYQIDKKVIKVSGQTTALSGTAVDVLENVPSVDVDIDGNVKLRGSGSFQVLIDGKPTILESSEALQLIPASSIEDIEIITNPSAKYDPDGVAGIINIVLKKNKLRGISGMINGNAGTYGRYGGDALLSYRHKNLIFNLSTNYNRRNFPGNQTLKRRTINNGQIFYTNSNGDSRWTMIPYGIRAGLDINLGHWDVLSIGGRVGNRSMERHYDLAYRENSPLKGEFEYRSNDLWKRSGDYYAVNAGYQHRWPQKDHRFSAQIIFNRRTGDEISTNELWQKDGSLSDRKRTLQDGPGQSLRLKMDYTCPVNAQTKWEAGYQSRFSNSDDNSELYNYDLQTKRYVFQPLFSHQATSRRDIHSLYVTFSSRLAALGYQLGLRAEYTYRTISVKDSQTFKIDRLDVYPSVHLSYRFGGGRQIMASYTRRIRRARPWFLEPFLTWTDAYNVRRGNPALKPEYIDSYEVGHQLFWGRSLLSLEAYYRVTNNKVERVRSVYPYHANVILQTFENVGKDYSLGVEFLLNRDIFKWWNVNYMGTLYRYRVEGRLNALDFSNSSFNWGLRFNNDFRLGKHTRVQLNLRYKSPTVTSQGRSEAFFSTDLALKQQFFKRKLSVTLQARDLFNTMRHEYTSEGTNFYYYRSVDHPGPLLSLTVSWIFNNYKQPKRQNVNGENSMSGEEDLF